MQSRVAHHLEERFRIMHARPRKQDPSLSCQLLIEQGYRTRFFIRGPSEHEENDILWSLRPGMFVPFDERVACLP